MNCKQGDLAVIVRSASGNEGKIVRCVKFAGVVRFYPYGKYPSWEVDPPVPSIFTGTTDCIPDAELRPIRDPGADAKDETLHWLPVPSIERVEA